MRKRTQHAGVSLAAVIASVMFAAPATAQPAPDPCGFAFSLLCRMFPIAPELDHDIDLTTEQPPMPPGPTSPEVVTGSVPPPATPVA